MSVRSFGCSQSHMLFQAEFAAIFSLRAVVVDYLHCHLMALTIELVTLFPFVTCLPQPAGGRKPALEATNCSVLRITNNGVFEANVDVSLAGGDTGSLEETVTGSGPSVFEVEPKELLNLAVGETREIKLWAFPREVRCTALSINATPLPGPALSDAFYRFFAFATALFLFLLDVVSLFALCYVLFSVLFFV